MTDLERMNNPAKLTPMMKQYLSLKERYFDCILFYRLGDFYEMFFDDALVASKLLQITLTARNKGEDRTPMCGVPYHAAEQYIAKLTRAGRKVAVCEQLSDPNNPGIVDRDVVRIVTPGTTLDENVLDGKTNNYVMAVTLVNQNKSIDEIADEFAEIAFADLTTGEFKSTTIKGDVELRAEIERIDPAEVVVPDYQFESEVIKKIRSFFERKCFFPQSKDLMTRDFEGEMGNMEPKVNYVSAVELLEEYLKSTQKRAMPHIDDPIRYEVTDYMPLDEATTKNLELIGTLREGQKEGSLIWVIDKTVTSMGGRLLRNFIIHPLVDKGKIDLRLDAVEELVGKQSILADIRTELKEIMDIERLLGRLSLGRGNARDLLGLKVSLEKIPRFKMLLEGMESELLIQICNRLNPLDEITGLINRAIIENPPVAIGDGGIIADGFDLELDELRAISREGKSFIQNMQKEEALNTGISNLKVRYNKVFGYYIEVSKGNVGKVPESYIRKQTLVNAERFITPELKEFEAKILGAEEKIVVIEERIFNEVRDMIVGRIKEIKNTARLIAMMDVVCSNAVTALANDYCRPKVFERGVLNIIAGRHPVVERMSANNSFVPNDLRLGGDVRGGVLDVMSGDVQAGEGAYIHLITGPNMGGKSTFLRQTALIVLMAQIGSFVPAKEASIPLIDKIFTRVGASDNLVRGQSTFMVEMQETAHILANATERSLIILDEVGRGTSTYDGMSIAWAILEYLHENLKAKTLFATHYHELISLTEGLAGAANYAVAVKEKSDEGIVFLYKIREGGVDRSYGIEVAKLAGLPEECIKRARQILVDLEEGIVEKGIKMELLGKVFAEEKVRDIDWLERGHSSLAGEFEKINVNEITPIEALNKLVELKNKYGSY